eukprot:m.1368169 g.1368169  ORF g.1368169 m.1368169 type:complete len:572 (-) comp24954_c1_seq8:4114-5829(-)
MVFSGDVLLTTFQTLGAYILLCALGAILAKYPKRSPMLPRIVLQPLGRLSMQILLPALLITTLGKQLSIEVLKDSYPIFFWSIAMQFVGFMIAQALQFVVHVPKNLQQVFTCAIVYGNCGSLPLVVVETLSRQEPLATDEKALEKLTTFIFLYLVGWLLSFWSGGLIYLVRGMQASHHDVEPIAMKGEILAASSPVKNVPRDAWVATPEKNISSTAFCTQTINDSPMCASMCANTIQDMDVSGMIVQLSSYTSDVGGSPPTEEDVFSVHEQDMFACSLPGPPDAATGIGMVPTATTFIEHNSQRETAELGGTAATGERLRADSDVILAALDKACAAHGQVTKCPRVSQSYRSQILYALFNPLMSAVWLGLFVGLVHPVQSVFFDSDAELAFVASALETLGKPAIGIITLLMSASLGGFLDKRLSLRAANRQGNAPIEAGAKIVLENKLPKTSTDPCVTPPTSRGNPQEVPTSVLVALALGRCILFPAVNLCLVFYFADSILPDSADRKYMKLVLAIESATPSADTIIVVCMQYGHREIAEVLAASYLLQYFIDMLPLAVAIGVSLSSFFES